MRIAIIGGAGAMGRVTAMDLSENDKVKEILIADYQSEKAEECAAGFNDPRVKASFVDANKVDDMAGLLQGYDAVINAAQYYVNLNVMRACLKAGAHYNDLGGMFHTTREQLKLSEDFKKAKLTAVLGIGAAPGITNVLARYGYDQLDEVEIVQVSDAGIDLTDMKGIDVFTPPYSIRTIMEEYTDESVQFLDGEYRTLPPLSGRMEIEFPSPIGRQICIHTLHSEPATIPESFKNKGVKEVTWRLSLPAEFEERAQFLASVGFGSKQSLKVQGVDVVPVEVLAAVIEKQLEDKLKGVALEVHDEECLRAQVIGKKNGRNVECTVDCLVATHSRWGVSHATSVPPAIAAEMQVKGDVEPGVWGPEQAIDPLKFFKELGKREMRIQVTRKEDVT